MNPLRAHTTPIPTPLWVRLGGSALAGAAVAVGTSRIHFGLALELSLLFLLAACALVLLHPYRADLRATTSPCCPTPHSSSRLWRCG